MRIAINILYNASGGSLIEIRQVLEVWAKLRIFEKDEFILFTNPKVLSRLASNGLPLKELFYKVIIFYGSDKLGILRVFNEQLLLPIIYKLLKIDVVYSPANIIPYLTKIPKVVMFQNAAPFCQNINLKTGGLQYFMRLWILRQLILQSSRRAQKIIFVSNYFKTVICSKVLMPSNKYRVLYHPTGLEENMNNYDDPEIIPKYGISKPYLIMASGIYPYKNISELIRGFIITTRKLNLNVQLIIAGRNYSKTYSQEISELLKTMNINNDEISLIGEIPHNDVLKLIKHSLALIFSSTCENCPIILLEAMSLGVPILSSNANVMPEICGNAALFFNPYDILSISKAIEDFLISSTLPSKLAKLSALRAKNFPTRDIYANEIYSEIVSAGNNSK